ncbi:N-acetylneuraminate synthase family protein [Kineococcus sp. SYSU DK001]|uniref:N-acetylneuraminate synthase family protein n=1 Tax=Kineococcus sp. SYSU DK001 TaxID=3383122 RepID=UPI003D7CD66F
MTGFSIGGRPVGPDEEPLVIAEIGINHEGDLQKAIRMVDDAATAGAECVKFQCHVIDDEMIPNDVVPGNAQESIWDIMSRCALSETEDRELKAYVEGKGLVYLSTPFSRAAADRLADMGVTAYKIGSGECNNYPLVRHIAGLGKPVILSTGMNDVASVSPSVEIMRQAGVPFMLFHCTSMYPTPYDRVMLNGMTELRDAFPDALVGLSDHSLGNYTSFAAVALGAVAVEKHFTSDLSWPGPDVPISLDPAGLADLIVGTRAVHAALGGSKRILPEEAPTIAFAYASVVTIQDISPGDPLTMDNIWVKRPGTGSFLARDFQDVLGKVAACHIPKDVQLQPEHLVGA